ncbi:MAG: translation initiation factor IF-2 N-terminal domain-containing protein, partial [Gemmatimonadota bacterium]|nr:translation initiation factor IF-2 N-terminal domain-containing protein [Gemmatimonadota bacterium]
MKTGTGEVGPGWVLAAEPSGSGAKTGKVRIYQVAREHDVSSEAVLKIVRDMGVAVKSHMSSIEVDTVEAVRLTFDREKEVARQDD